MRKVYISENAPPPMVEYLVRQNHELRFVTNSPVTYAAVAAHADLFFCRMGAGETAEVFAGDPRELGFAYPHNIKFNAVWLDRYFIHHLKYTSPALLDRAQAAGLTLVNVRQGYTKCNIVVVDGQSVITADEGILRVLRQYPDLRILPVRQGYVRLSGFDYGFLGGASGRVGNEIVFNGDLSRHPDFRAICRFIERRGLTVRYFPSYELEDIGSIITGEDAVGSFSPFSQYNA